jgi:hypothetical protein
MTGTAYYDFINAGRSVWIDRGDIAGRGFAEGCNRVDHPDDGGPYGDKDRDHDRDDHDDKYDRNRKDRWH